jgi:hypothetical protein
MNKSATKGDTPAQKIDARIKDVGGWRSVTLERIRALIKQADPKVVEEWKWNIPVWSHDGIICTGETYKQVVKMTFANGAALKDPARLFNSSLEGNVRRAIDIREGEKINEKALIALIRAAVALNASKTKAMNPKTPKTPKAKKAGAKVVLLSGGNPQIAMADGDAVVQKYIAAMPGWKRDVGARLDALIVRTVPNVTKAVKWNSPFYGVPGRGWFISFHTFTKFVKVTFFKGTALRPAPAGGNAKEARWIDIHEDDFDEAQMTKWIKQAAALPGYLQP